MLNLHEVINYVLSRSLWHLAALGGWIIIIIVIARLGEYAAAAITMAMLVLAIYLDYSSWKSQQ